MQGTVLGSKGQTAACSAARQKIQGQRWSRQPASPRLDLRCVVMLAVFADLLKQLPRLRLLKEAPAGHTAGPTAVLERQPDLMSLHSIARMPALCHAEPNPSPSCATPSNTLKAPHHKGSAACQSC